VTKKLCTQVNIILEYTLFGKVQNILISKGFTIKDVIYEQDVEIIVFVPKDEVDAFIDMINEATNARVIVQKGDSCYITLDSQGKIVADR